MASRASSARSSPWSSITVSTPREPASSTNPNFSTLPPPDHGLHNRTGYKGRLTRCTRPAAVVRRLAANAARAARTAIAEERKADESSDEGLPVLAPGAKQRGDQRGDTQDRPDDAVPAARAPAW